MARKKVPVNETSVESASRKAQEALVAIPSRADKATWDRRMNEMVSLLSKINPIEDKIIELMVEKQPIMDQVALLRREMVNTCVHPSTHLVTKTDSSTHLQYIECKFCMRKFTFNNLSLKNG